MSLEDGARIDSSQMLGFLHNRVPEILNLRFDTSGLEVVLIHFSSPAD
jgi:hypothetical protein